MLSLGTLNIAVPLSSGCLGIIYYTLYTLAHTIYQKIQREHLAEQGHFFLQKCYFTHLHNYIDIGHGFIILPDILN